CLLHQDPARVNGVICVGVLRDEASATRKVELFAEACARRVPSDPPHLMTTLQFALIRDLFGNSARRDTAAPFWLCRHDGLVTRLAQAIFDENAFDRLPILADALTDVGCTDADILNHCRQPGEHVRGCWLVDLLLGKE